MAGIKKFTPKAAQSKRKPLEFEIYDETFSAVPHLQGTTLINFIEASTEPDEDKANSALIAEVMPFFKSALLPESYERFVALTESHEKIVEFDDLMEIVSWLISEYTARPTSGSDK